MTANRARAYSRVLALVDGLGPAKLHAAERQTIRDAADAVLFTLDIVSDPDAAAMLRRLDVLMDRLVAGGRLLEETADDIVEAVERCGPHTEPLRLPALA